MNCPSCGEELKAGERCSSCGAVVAPAVEGALAPSPRAVTPPPRLRDEPLRELPGLRKRERTWREEVQERMRSRRQKRAAANLPLFDPPAIVPQTPPPALVAEAPPSTARPEALAPFGVSRPPTEVNPEFASPILTEAELADLPLRHDRPVTAPSLDAESFVSEGEDEEPQVELRAPEMEPSPVERPARAFERTQAAVLDLGLLVALWALVGYFASRAAQADLMALAPSWPWLVAYMALLGLAYASYFTGTTGQTPGKMATGLRVVDTSGHPPGYGRALLRAAVGAAGALLAGLGLLPMAFDPAQRALHDRLFGTRVVKR